MGEKYDFLKSEVVIFIFKENISPDSTKNIKLKVSGGFPTRRGEWKRQTQTHWFKNNTWTAVFRNVRVLTLKSYILNKELSYYLKQLAEVE